jgi:transcriptional regulator with XRE-family HTH domain
VEFDGQALVRARARRGLTQEQLAAAAGTTFSTISRLERGLAEPTLTTINKLAVALDMPVSALLAENGAAA